jgi:hypothetical protein
MQFLETHARANHDSVGQSLQLTDSDFYADKRYQRKGNIYSYVTDILSPLI